jgi:hypothetical protein
LLIPNAATDGDNRRLLLLLLTAVPLTKKELLQTTTKDALLAIAISGIDNAVPLRLPLCCNALRASSALQLGRSGCGEGVCASTVPTQDRLTR